MHGHGDAGTLKFAAVVIAIVAVSGYALYSLYSENRSQAATILDQAGTIISQSQQISSLSSDVQNKTKQIADLEVNAKELGVQIGQLGLQVADLSERLGITQQSLEELKPTIRDYYVVGVQSDGSGVVIPLEVKISKGTGAVSASINNVELLSGVQDSIRTAASVASQYTGVPISDKDITVSFVNNGANLVTVDGGSGGAAITTTIIATLTDRLPDTSVLVTGTIQPDGGVGEIGSAEAKAKAAKGFGANTFLVPTADGGFSVPGEDIVAVDNITQVVDSVLKS